MLVLTVDKFLQWNYNSLNLIEEVLSMNRSQSIYRLAVAALLCAVGIMIPMVMPAKIYIPPMSFTLASHVAIFLAMCISPGIALAVSLGTTVGFVFSGLPMDVWLRALSHVVWAVGGALWLKKYPDTFYSAGSNVLFCGATALVHAILELVVVFALYLGGLSGMVEKFASGGFTSIILLVGVGTFLHSCVDYAISLLVWRPIRKVGGVAAIATAH